MEKQIENLMKNLGVSEDEAKQIILDDQEVDRMETKEVDNDLTQEQKQAIKKMKNAGVRKPTIYKHDTRPRKADQEKRELVEYLAAALKMLECEITVTNPERQLDFEFKGRRMRVVLSAPRK